MNWLTTQESTTREKVEDADTKLQEYRTEKNEVSLEDTDNLVRQSLFTAKADAKRVAARLSEQYPHVRVEGNKDPSRR